MYNAPTSTISATRTTAIMGFRQTTVRKSKKKVKEMSEAKSVLDYLLT
jgi:hypothetical protein